MAYVVTARWTVAEGAEDRVLAAVEALGPLARAEPGCLFYQPARDPDDPRVFFFYELYVDEAAFDAHRESDHFRRYVLDDVIPHLADRERGIYQTID